MLYKPEYLLQNKNVQWLLIHKPGYVESIMSNKHYIIENTYAYKYGCDISLQNPITYIDEIKEYQKNQLKYVLKELQQNNKKTSIILNDSNDLKENQKKKNNNYYDFIFKYFFNITNNK